MDIRGGAEGRALDVLGLGVPDHKSLQSVAQRLHLQLPAAHYSIDPGQMSGQVRSLPLWNSVISGGSGEIRGENDLSTLSALSNIDSVDSVGSNGSCQMETLLVFLPHILPSLQGFPKNGFSSTRARSQRERVGLGVRQEGRRVATITPQCHDGLAHEH